VGRLALEGGYGKPHWAWVGTETISAITPYFSSFQAGLHASLVVVDAMITWRRTYSFSHGLIAELASVSAADLERSGTSKLQYDVLDASLWGFIPYRRLLLTWEFTYVLPLALDTRNLLYEEVQRAVVSRRGLWTTKVAPMLKPVRNRAFYAGVLVEQLALMGRSRPLELRAGPSIWANLGDHWDLYGYLSWPVVSPDSLGFWGGLYGSVGLLFRMATGEPTAVRP
jgi:hypothetical protein